MKDGVMKPILKSKIVSVLKILNYFSARPHYLPREFANIYIMVVYIQPNADVNSAASKIQ